MRSNWKLKAIVQKGISYFPQKEKINYWFQKRVTKGVELSDDHFRNKITHSKDHLYYFRKHSSKELKECNVLELGTGWYPIVPIAMYLSDVEEVISIDLRDWVKRENMYKTIRTFQEWRQRGELDLFLDYINEEKWKSLGAIVDEQKELKETCEIIGLKRIIGDARKTDLESASIDLICSNNTFEHIPENILEDILKEFKRVLKPGGVMSHFIDMTDHFAHFDSSITIYNFLKYSDRKWKRIDNSIQPQNRMRFKDYKAMYENQDIEISEEKIRPGNREEVASVSLAAKYKDYTVEEIAISHGYIVTKINND